MTDRVLDSENWRLEAGAIITDVKDHVKNIEISEVLTSTNQEIHLNLTTKEDVHYCIQLSSVGFCIVGDKYDTMNINQNEWYETPYSLLNKISPLFNMSFGNALLSKLNELNK